MSKLHGLPKRGNFVSLKVYERCCADGFSARCSGWYSGLRYLARSGPSASLQTSSPPAAIDHSSQRRSLLRCKQRRCVSVQCWAFHPEWRRPVANLGISDGLLSRPGVVHLRKDGTLFETHTITYHYKTIYLK